LVEGSEGMAHILRGVQDGLGLQKTSRPPDATKNEATVDGNGLVMVFRAFKSHSGSVDSRRGVGYGFILEAPQPGSHAAGVSSSSRGTGWECKQVVEGSFGTGGACLRAGGHNGDY
jgi:hypothetical protein